MEATIFTAQYHKSRGYCCKSECLHCPWGHVIQPHNLNALPWAQANEDTKKLFEKKQEGLDVSSFLSAGLNEKPDTIKEEDLILFIKNHPVSIIRNPKTNAKLYKTLPEFLDQKLDIDLIMAAINA